MSHELDQLIEQLRENRLLRTQFQIAICRFAREQGYELTAADLKALRLNNKDASPAPEAPRGATIIKMPTIKPTS